MPIFNRRQALGAGLTLTGATMLPGFAMAQAATAKRFVFVIQRGAADGLAIVPPVGDGRLRPLRAELVEDGAQKLDAMFALHPAMAATYPLFMAGEGRIIHAVASAYRDRSHFDGQNVLESGGTHPYAFSTGWMGRMLPLLPASESSALALSAAVPLALRGPRQVATYAPNALPAASDDLIQRVSMMYQHDAQLAPVWTEALKTRRLTSDIGGNDGKNGADIGKLAATLMVPADGARVVMIETGGWDTHSAERGRLAAQLKGLDRLVSELRAGLGPAWRDTLVLVATEFGRTAAVNGTNGTDHGTASAMMLFGGALPQGRPVEADWPGLNGAQLYQDRDLKPTRAIEDVVVAQLSHHYGIEPDRLNRTLFPRA